MDEITMSLITSYLSISGAIGIGLFIVLLLKLLERILS